MPGVSKTLVQWSTQQDLHWEYKDVIQMGQMWPHGPEWGKVWECDWRGGFNRKQSYKGQLQVLGYLTSQQELWDRCTEVHHSHALTTGDRCLEASWMVEIRFKSSIGLLIQSLEPRCNNKLATGGDRCHRCQDTKTVYSALRSPSKVNHSDAKWEMKWGRARMSVIATIQDGTWTIHQYIRKMNSRDELLIAQTEREIFL